MLLYFNCQFQLLDIYMHVYCNSCKRKSVMLVLGLGLKANFCDLGLRGLALAKNSRPKSWQTTKFTINFRPLEHGDWIELYFKICVLTYLQWAIVALLEYLKKEQHFVTFYRNPCIMGWPWPWDCGLGLGLECSGLVNITGANKCLHCSFV